MGGRLLLIEGKIQRSPEGVVHLVSDRITDRSFELDRLSEDRFRPQVHADQIPPPPLTRGKCNVIRATFGYFPNRGTSINPQDSFYDEIPMLRFAKRVTGNHG